MSSHPSSTILWIFAHDRRSHTLNTLNTWQQIPDIKVSFDSMIWPLLNWWCVRNFDFFFWSISLLCVLKRRGLKLLFAKHFQKDCIFNCSHFHHFGEMKEAEVYLVWRIIRETLNLYSEIFEVDGKTTSCRLSFWSANDWIAGNFLTASHQLLRVGCGFRKCSRLLLSLFFIHFF